MPLKNPEYRPIQMEHVIAVDPDKAFDVFTQDFGKWWPVETHSLAREKDVLLEFHAGLGGEIVETAKGKSPVIWGKTEIWQPGEYISILWYPGWNSGDFTRLEVSFDQNMFGRCVMRLEHGGWENLGEAAGALRDGYQSGWQYILEECFVRYLKTKDE